MAGGSTRDLVIPASTCGVPTTARAYSLNIGVLPLSALGYLTIWPTGVPQPFVSTLNSLNGSVVANAALVPAGNNASVSLFVTNDTHVFVDINGYFAPERVLSDHGSMPLHNGMESPFTLPLIL